MARVVLINPPSPERLGAPLLGQQYVAASLLRAGHDVQVIDAAARQFDGDAISILAEVEAFEPDLVGMALFTRWVFHAYALAAELHRLADRLGFVLVAGGAHPTCRPREPLHHGFDATIAGEAELAILEVLEALDTGHPLAGISGVVARTSDGRIVEGPPRTFVEDLDALARPTTAQHLWRGEWYGPHGATAPPGLLTSRGCPSRCTFCANYVTGRGFRFHSDAAVVDELHELHARTGSMFFPFWDDALTANRRRLRSLCERMISDVELPLTWSAITRANMVTPPLLRLMKRAGCVAVNFGVESGDDEILRAIKKGVGTDTVVRALEQAKEVGLQTACNFMLGFPQEKPEHVENTLRFMERIAPLVDVFSTLGVVVPFPGTPLYEAYHEHYGFTDWWLDERYSHSVPAPSIDDREAYHRYYIDDANLELDFFRYSTSMRAAIREGLRFKAEHNLRYMGMLPAAKSA